MFWRKRNHGRTIASVNRAIDALHTIEREMRRIHPEIITPQDATEIRRQLIETASLSADILESVCNNLTDEGYVGHRYPQRGYSHLD